ncbi:sigma-70 family RNA polymerase sigma factor [Cytobacillus purgationiresistens]|uniref:RNA polymerase sigma-70 factor (ECF subfamily) n=1 Tax=Cytobacillus purgationiresistens TaxID=863449 RepID=A0ABU0AJF4_9BACI|nr:sigma-70 family RNA polymerase sigma factor [Cytobacillus purgationiresistens]MDQ0270877.1 RNA polymerase sigma-70 factor (ECF subfamily) [Cytobacillus purgationiresistens]
MYGKSSEGMEHKEAEETILNFYPGLVRYCCFLCQNEWDGKDVAQEALLKAWKHYRLSERVTPALLNKIAYHHWIDTVRKRKKETLTEVPDEISNDQEHLNETVETLLEKLTPKQALIFTLKEAFLFKSHEIAELLEMNESAIKGILYRAKTRLGKESAGKTDSFWDEELREQVFPLFYDALKFQNPEILLELLPYFHEEKVSPSIAKPYISTPSNTFCMAA